jgi:hypothetical protein
MILWRLRHNTGPVDSHADKYERDHDEGSHNRSVIDRADVGYWPIASFLCDAAIQSLLE